MPEELVRLKDVTVSFDGELILDKVNFTVNEKDYTGIIGPNGSGKTTLLRVILGLVQPDSGSVTVLGKSPEKGRRSVGYVPQFTEFDKVFPISVWEFVMMGRLPKSSFARRYTSEDREKAVGALKRVDLLNLKDKQLGVLSGGEKQRAYIARALATDPKILLLDEPTANIDLKMETGFYDLLSDLRNEVAVVLVSHDISVISVKVDKIACLNKQLFMHESSEIDEHILEETYKCPVEMIAHGVPHRVLKDHGEKGAH
jgi:zinc transport system ATP-binding protein